MPFITTLTTLGQAKIATAISTNTPLNISEMAWGDGGGSPITPTGAMTALVNERYRFGINSAAPDPLNPPYVIFTGIIPTATGGFYVRECGLFDEDGDMIAVGSLGETYKPTLAEGSAKDFVTRFILNVGNVSAVTLLIDPAVVLASRKWVNDNYQLLITGGTTDQILAKNSNTNGDFKWINQSLFLRAANKLSEILALGSTAQKEARQNLGILDMAGATSKQITSVTADAFAVKDVLAHDGTNWIFADNRTDEESEARAVVVEKINSTNYIVVTHGFADLPSLLANTQYFLGIDGQLTATPPAPGSGRIIKPILITNETGKAVINISAFGKRA